MITTRGFASSLIAYWSQGCSLAAFIPLVAENYSGRTSGSSAPFLTVWVFADIVNIVGLIKIPGATPSQIILAGWYGLTDVILWYQLCCFGSHARFSPQRNDEKEGGIISKRSEKARDRARRLGTWTAYNDFLLLVTMVLICTLWWGVYTIIMMMKDPTWSPPLAESTDSLAMGLGFTGQLLFGTSRLIEIGTAEWAHYHHLRPTIGDSRIDSQYTGVKSNFPQLSSGTVILFFFLMLENILQVIALVILAPFSNSAYFYAQAPWIAGASFPIPLDLYILFRIPVWQNRWALHDVEGKLEVTLRTDRKNILYTEKQILDLQDQAWDEDDHFPDPPDLKDEDEHHATRHVHEQGQDRHDAALHQKFTAKVIREQIRHQEDVGKRNREEQHLRQLLSAYHNDLHSLWREKWNKGLHNPHEDRHRLPLIPLSHERGNPITNHDDPHDHRWHVHAGQHSGQAPQGLARHFVAHPHNAGRVRNAGSVS